MRLDDPGGDEFGELGFEGGAVGTGEGDGFGVGERFAGLEEGGELAGEWAELRAVRIEALLEAGDLLADAAEGAVVVKERVGNRMKTAECRRFLFRDHSVVFILLPSLCCLLNRCYFDAALVEIDPLDAFQPCVSQQHVEMIPIRGLITMQGGDDEGVIFTM
jgi:hypothetical protein